MKDRMPHVRREGDADKWYIGDTYFGSIGGNVISRSKGKLLGRIAYTDYDQWGARICRQLHARFEVSLRSGRAPARECRRAMMYRLSRNAMFKVSSFRRKFC